METPDDEQSRRCSVSEHNQIDNALGANQPPKRFDSLIEALPQIVWSADPSGMITRFNRRWYEYSGFDHTSSDRDFYQAIHPHDSDRVASAWRQAVAQARGFQTELRLRGADGTFRWFTAEATPIWNETKQLQQWVGTLVDIDPWKQAEVAAPQHIMTRLQAEHFLAEAAQELSRSLDYRITLASVTRLAVPQLADWAVVSLVEEDGTVRQLEVAHVDPEKVGLAWELNCRYPDRADSSYGVSHVIRTGNPELVSQIPDQLLTQVARDFEHLQVLRSLGLKSYMIVPLVARERTLGAITFITAESDRHYTQADLKFAQALADRAALAIDNARLFQTVEQELIERRYMQAVLLESEERFRVMADSAPVLLWVSGTNAQFNFFNQEWLNFTGRTLEQEVGDGWAAGVHPDDLQHCLQTYLAAFETRQPFEMEYRLRRSDGEYRWLLNRGAPRFLSDGSFAGFIGSCIDMTDRKQAQEALQTRADELTRLTNILTHTTAILEKRNQELNQFAYVVSHDLKAPLRAIANLSQWLEEDLSDRLTEETQHQMNLLRGRVHRMENMINGLLQYSRIGRTAAQQETVAVETLLHDVIDSLAPPTEFMIDIQPGMPTLRTDRLRLEQVFANLINNAIKHHDRSTGHIQITVCDRGSNYEFGVIDDGPGIAPAYHTKVFDIFQTLEARDKVENTGIGLSLVKRIVEDKGGSVWIESQPGKGARVLFTWRKK